VDLSCIAIVTIVGVVTITHQETKVSTLNLKKYICVHTQQRLVKNALVYVVTPLNIVQNILKENPKPNLNPNLNPSLKLSKKNHLDRGLDREAKVLVVTAVEGGYIL
tara:strand:- start:108 stop:428 length:321 start_codon:yes stop_codon:yes gene_type:complete